MRIRPTNGTSQRFRLRHDDIVLRGTIDDFDAPLRASWTLNQSRASPFYVEQTPDIGTDWVNAYKSTPAELRCKELGEFCVEIPAACPDLIAGHNTLVLATEDSRGRKDEIAVRFAWDPTPIPLPLDLRDLTAFAGIQDVGMALNGAFELDRAANVIRSRAPVAPDAFLIIGSRHASQEATYAVRFLEPAQSKWLGLSDFMAGQEEGRPPRGLKVGWSSAGMAALSPREGARSFLAWGDHSGRAEEWAIATHPAAPFVPAKNTLYRVRHQVGFDDGVNQVRFRIWPDGTDEPATWLCVEQDDAVPAHLPRHTRASFGLFQHLGMPVEWSDIRLASLPPDPADRVRRDRGREPFVGRKRPGAF